MKFEVLYGMTLWTFVTMVLLLVLPMNCQHREQYKVNFFGPNIAPFVATFGNRPLEVNSTMDVWGNTTERLCDMTVDFVGGPLLSRQVILTVERNSTNLTVTFMEKQYKRIMPIDINPEDACGLSILFRTTNLLWIMHDVGIRLDHAINFAEINSVSIQSAHALKRVAHLRNDDLVTPDQWTPLNEVDLSRKPFGQSGRLAIIGHFMPYVDDWWWDYGGGRFPGSKMCHIELWDGTQCERLTLRFGHIKLSPGNESNVYMSIHNPACSADGTVAKTHNKGYITSNHTFFFLRYDPNEINIYFNSKHEVAWPIKRGVVITKAIIKHGWRLDLRFLGVI